MRKDEIMKKKMLSAIKLLTILAVFLFSSACHYAIDDLPGCNDCTTTLDEAILDELVNKIEDGDYGNIHSLIIIHNDSLALEEYFMEWNRHMLQFCASVTKSFTSAAIGIAIEEGYISGVEEKLLNFFPEYDDIENLDERKESITLENVLTMTAGFTWDETAKPAFNIEGNPNPENDLAKMSESDDWIKYVLDRPLSDNPGTRWNYNSGGSHLLSGILQKGTNQSLEEFTGDNLFSALGITNWKWVDGIGPSDPNGITTGGWGLTLHPVDMAMFGYLYLKKGVLNGNQIVPENWVNESTINHISFYGYQWWVSPDVTNVYPEREGMYYARGYFGQFIVIIPNSNMVIVSTAENETLKDQAAVFNMLFDYILPAVKEK
jgi:CubicO group peptidase (beta-lactamase class C family)